MRGNFISFVKKEFLHILRDVRTMLIVLLIPVVLMVLFGFAISTEINNLNVAIVVPNKTETVRQSIDRLANNPYFTLLGEISSSDIDQVLRSGKANAVVVFDEDYDRLLAQRAQGIDTHPAIQYIFDASDTNMAQSGVLYLQSVLGSDLTKNQLLNLHLLYNPQMKSAYNFVPGIMGLIFILICAMMTSVSIVREKEVGTMEVLLVSPVRPIKIILAKMIPYFVISCINLATILVISHFLLEVPLSSGWVSITIVSLIYLLLALVLGLFISAVSPSQSVALLVSGMLLMMPMMMLSGMVFPLENLPDILSPLPNIVPARWYIEAIRKMMIMGLPLSAVWKECLIMIVMIIVLLVISLKLFKDKLE
jgi:ABC-2 type transport system permease protein